MNVNLKELLAFLSHLLSLQHCALLLVFLFSSFMASQNDLSGYPKLGQIANLKPLLSRLTIIAHISAVSGQKMVFSSSSQSLGLRFLG